MSCNALAFKHTKIFSPHEFRTGKKAHRLAIISVIVVLGLASSTTASPLYDEYHSKQLAFLPQTWQELLETYYQPWEAAPDARELDDLSTHAKRQEESSFDMDERRPDYSFGLGKREKNYAFGLGKRLRNDYSFGLGKRGNGKDYAFGLGKRGSVKEYSFGLGKRLKDYSFGLGKRSKSYSFGLGKRAADVETVDDIAGNHSTETAEPEMSKPSSGPLDENDHWLSTNQDEHQTRHKREVDIDDERDVDDETDLSLIDKRKNLYGFGLGKRNAYDDSGNRGHNFNFGLGKRSILPSFGYPKRMPDHYSFGLGKRSRPPFSFGIGKRIPSKYSFGIGKRLSNVEQSSPTYQYPYSLLKYLGLNQTPYSPAPRFGRRSYDFGLGKRAAGFPVYLQKKNRNDYSFGLGKRSESGDEKESEKLVNGNNPNAYSFELGKRFIEDYFNVEDEHDAISDEYFD
ncbi:hypothetical protein HAZT_HAZT002617 [Hyalella azteca]|uniref:Allatostatins n=1 Tax=Hyalella azteca TaxID=294128 RepID=A0A6A0GYF5_HYAAZ|nr:allatostatins [Hyalella azteca]KAA0192975.1 hypothetical protein HAZT_HAZT002617 [Hyalella azteca]